MERQNIIDSALTNFSTMITRTPTLAPAGVCSAIGYIQPSAIGASNQVVKGNSQNAIAVYGCKDSDESRCLGARCSK